MRSKWARGATRRSSLVWKYQRSVPQLPSLVVYRDVVYMLNDRGVLTTLDAARVGWRSQDRVSGTSDNYYASPVAGDGKIYLAAHKGVVTVLKAGGQQEFMAANPLDEDIFATPAIAGGRCTCERSRHSIVSECADRRRSYSIISKSRRFSFPWAGVDHGFRFGRAKSAPGPFR